MSDDDDYGPPYVSLDEIDFSRMMTVFRSLVLFDDMFLNMQAMNLAMVDGFATDQEYALLREYIEIERTPTQQALFVSAISQMWIFALYELLRTWRQRIRKLRVWKESGALDQMLARVNSDEHNLAALMRSTHIEWVRDDDTALLQMNRHEELLQPILNTATEIRVNLAKHEVRGRPNVIVRAPGYGRINGYCGALDYELDYGDNTYQTINRRDLADAIRELPLPTED